MSKDRFVSSAMHKEILVLSSPRRWGSIFKLTKKCIHQWIPAFAGMTKHANRNDIIFCFSWLLILIAGRIVPHLPNMTPTLSLCVFGMWWFRRKFFFLFALFAIEISDFLLAKYYGYSPFGFWTLFNDSAYLCIMFATLIFQTHFRKFFSLQFFSLLSCLFFWLWTNFGVWLFSTMYPHTLSGFMACYVMALPFLKNALIADLIWITVLWVCIQFSGLKPKEYLIKANI